MSPTMVLPSSFSGNHIQYTFLLIDFNLHARVYVQRNRSIYRMIDLIIPDSPIHLQGSGTNLQLKHAIRTAHVFFLFSVVINITRPFCSLQSERTASNTSGVVSTCLPDLLIQSRHLSLPPPPIANIVSAFLRLVHILKVPSTAEFHNPGNFLCLNPTAA